MKYGRTDDPLDSATAADDFDESIHAVVGRCPGYLGSLYELYLGGPGPAVDFVGRFERLVDDACAALRLAEEEFFEPAMRSHPVENAGGYERFVARYEPATAALIARAERATIARFYATNPVPRRLLAA